MIYISLVETEKANIAIEHDDFFDALRTTNSLIDNKDHGKIFAAQVFETEEIIMGTEEIKKNARLVASLRTFR
jgi:hypothetical protein